MNGTETVGTYPVVVSGVEYFGPHIILTGCYDRERDIMDGFCVSLPFFFIHYCCWLYTLLFFLLFPSPTQAHSGLLGMAVYACDGWMGMVCGMVGLLAAWFMGCGGFSPGQFSDGMEFRKGMSLYFRW
jgi:hypothetical protein